MPGWSSGARTPTPRALSGRDLPPSLALAADDHVTAAVEYLVVPGSWGTLGHLRARAYLGLLRGLPRSP